jgi:two-component system, OmpR family, phosphate regulon sensor histidine kinase PhoR
LRLSIQAKLFLMSIALIAASMGGADAYLTPLVVDNVTDVMRADTLARARLAARAAGRSQAPFADVAGWAALADELARQSGGRVAIVRPDGSELADSEAGPARFENLASSPEVRAALESGEGTSLSAGSASEPGILYAAVAVSAGGPGRDGGTVVVRVAQSLGPVERAREDVRGFIWFSAAVALGLALVMANVAKRMLSSAVRKLTDTARRMTQGDLSVRTRVVGHDDLAELGHELDRLAGSLARTLGELRTERDLQRRILEAMQEGVAVVDRDGRIVLVNPALRAMLLLGADAVGKLLIETVRHAQLEDLLDAARDGSDNTPLEIELPGLKPRRILAHAAPLSGDDEGLLVVFVDVTELRRLESLRRDFVANASHELRTPIAAVRSATETLRGGALDEPEAAIRFVDIIDRNAQRLQSLLEDMLELSKLESNEFKLKRERVELSSVVPIVLALFRERAEKKGVRLAAELPREPMAVVGDARALEHVLSNLVDNAIKYCPQGARIAVRAVAAGERVKLVVVDDGPGIAPEHLSRVFERFYRVDAGRSRELGGTGLGLSIVKHMVEAMRGRVAVESEIGRGATFTVSLPNAAG